MIRNRELFFTYMDFLREESDNRQLAFKGLLRDAFCWVPCGRCSEPVMPAKPGGGYVHFDVRVKPNVDQPQSLYDMYIEFLGGPCVSGDFFDYMIRDLDEIDFMLE